MNLVLIRAGYRPIPVPPEDRTDYIHAMAETPSGESAQKLQMLLYQRLSATLDDYLKVLKSGLRPGCEGL